MPSWCCCQACHLSSGVWGALGGVEGVGSMVGGASVLVGWFKESMGGSGLTAS